MASKRYSQPHEKDLILLTKLVENSCLSRSPKTFEYADFSPPK